MKLIQSLDERKIMTKTIRWGIIGTGNIAHQFARGLSGVDGSTLVAVASRTKDAADKFADEFNVTQRHVGVAEIAGNAAVDVIYVATPHPFHKDNTLQCLNGGKAVLCEKPFALNLQEATEMIQVARAKGLFLMEAIWTLFYPAMAKVREIVTSGAIGTVQLLQSNFCFRAGWNPESRLLSPELGGGALLDVGIYNVALARMIFGRDPSRINSMAHLGETGVDELSSLILGYDDGAMAVLTSAIRTNTSNAAVIYGTDGYIKIPHMFWKPHAIVVKAGQSSEETITFDSTGNGYNYEVEEVARCLRSGALESNIVPLDTTLSNMKILDCCREQWGLVYPMEK